MVLGRQHHLHHHGGAVIAVARRHGLLDLLEDALAADRVVHLLRPVQRDGDQAARQFGNAVGGVGHYGRHLKELSGFQHKILADHRLAAHEQHGLDVVLITHGLELVQQRGVVHLVVGVVGIVAAEDEAVGTIEVADIGYVDQSRRVLAVAEIGRIPQHAGLDAVRAQACPP